MLTCRRATERLSLSRSLDGPLAVGAKIGLEGHMLLCRHCRRFRKQIVILDALCREAGERVLADGGTELPAAARGRIAAALAQYETGGDR